MFNKISEELRNFIRANINSVSLLDVLFLLKKDPTHRWSPDDVSHEMRTNPSYALTQLLGLLAINLVKTEVTTSHDNSSIHYFYFNEAFENLPLIDELENLYTTKKASVINFIYSQPIDSIRSFAEAFKIKKDEDL